MKKVLCVCLLIVLMVSLTACNFEVSYKLPGDKEVTITNGKKENVDKGEKIDKGDIKKEENKKEDILKDKDNIVDSDKEVIEAKDSTKEQIATTWESDTTDTNPANWDEYVVVDVYSSEISDYESVGVKLLNIYKNEEAVKLIKEFIDINSFYKYAEPESGCHWEVFELGIDYAQFTISEKYGLYPSFNDFHLRTVGESSVFVGDKFYILTPNDITIDSEPINFDDSEKYGKVQIALTVPDNAENPVILLGSSYNEDLQKGYISYEKK